MASHAEKISAPARSRVLLVSSDRDFQAGPAAESLWMLAQSLARPFDLILAVPVLSASHHPDFAVIYYNRRNLPLIARDSDMVILDRELLARNPQLADLGEIVPATDLFEPEAAPVAEGPGRNAAALTEVEQLNSDKLLVLFPAKVEPPSGISHYIGRLRHYQREGGAGRVAAKAARFFGRRLFGRPSG